MGMDVQECAIEETEKILITTTLPTGICDHVSAGWFAGQSGEIIYAAQRNISSTLKERQSHRVIVCQRHREIWDRFVELMEL